MEFKEFIQKIEKYDFGIVSCNTYYQEGINNCYMMIAKRGNNGKFYKRECMIKDISPMLYYLLNDVKHNK